MILIPLPKTASRGDQIDNANYFEQNGFCKTILQENLTSELLLKEISYLKENKEKYIKNMSNSSIIVNGTNNVYHEILNAINNKI